MGHHIAVIILLGVLVTGAMLGIGMQRDARQADQEVQEYDFEMLARDVALTGLYATVRMLAEDYMMGSWTSGTYFTNEPYDNGTFTTIVTVNDPITGGASGDTVDVISRGYMGPAEHVIFARYARDKDDVGIPPAFKPTIVSDFFMQIDGNMLIASINDELNASIHTNDDLTLKGNSFLVEGFGTYTGTVNLNNQAEDNFIPNDDYNGDDVNHHWADSVRIPQLDWPKLLDRAQNISGTYSTTPLVVNGGVIDFTDPTSTFWEDNPGLTYNCTSGSCGTEENPFVIYVEGTADFENKVEIIGNGYIATTENIVISPAGSGGGVYGALNANQETTVILATQQDMEVGKAGGNACLGLGPASYTDNAGDTHSNNHCQSASGDFDRGVTLYVEDEVRFKGTPFIVGGVVAKTATFDGGGNPWITYASPNEGTLDVGFEYIIPIGPILIAYSEF